MKNIEKKSVTTSANENKHNKVAVYLLVLISLYKLGFCLKFLLEFLL
jgi:hypothetical protein